MAMEMRRDVIIVLNGHIRWIPNATQVHLLDGRKMSVVSGNNGSPVYKGWANSPEVIETSPLTYKVNKKGLFVLEISEDDEQGPNYFDTYVACHSEATSKEIEKVHEYASDVLCNYFGKKGITVENHFFDKDECGEW